MIPIIKRDYQWGLGKRNIRLQMFGKISKSTDAVMATAILNLFLKLGYRCTD